MWVVLVVLPHLYAQGFGELVLRELFNSRRGEEERRVQLVVMVVVVR